MVTEELEIGALNRTIYARTDVIESLSNLEELFPAEKILLERLKPKMSGSEILDIGIGGGRTINYLLAISPHYTGIDYVPEFVAQARKKHPTLQFLVGDARDLKEFEADEFDFVLFSFNGIDYISHDDRLKTLASIRRVLKNDGVLMFSTHNRDYKFFHQPPWREPFRSNIEYFKNLARHFIFRSKRIAMKKREILTDEYALISDYAYRYSLLTYYIGVSEQRRQLENCGFRDIEAVNLRGETVSNDDESFWVYYLAVK